MKPLPTFRDPSLPRLFSTIRSLRQAQRRDMRLHRHDLARTFRTWDEAQDALDSAACDGLIDSMARHRVVLTASGFALNLHKQEQ